MLTFVEKEPINWKTLQKYHLNPPKSADELQRTKFIQSCYNLKRRCIIDYTSYLLKLIFPEEDEKIGWKITKNIFPYNLEKTIEHKIFWIHPKFSFTEDQVLVLVKEYYKDSEFVLFKHRDSIRSNISIDHYQLFINKLNS